MTVADQLSFTTTIIFLIGVIWYLLVRPYL